MAQVLLQSNYYNYIKTGVNQSPNYKNQYSYIVPIYTFKYYSIENPNLYEKTYTYQQVFDFSLIALQYKSLIEVPIEVKDKWNKTDIEFYNGITMLPFVQSLYRAVVTASAYRAQGRKYTYTFTAPANLIPIYRKEWEPGQILSKCYTGDELVTIARNAQIFVNAYLFRGHFIDFSPPN